MQGAIVEPIWLARPSTEVAPDLLGCTLVRQLDDGKIIRGLIVETEAYGPDDPASHAYRKRTARNEVMFGPAGMSYIYLIYGRYRCLNIVTDQDGIASAVLIRALYLDTLPESLNLRQALAPHRVAAGPGKLCDVLQINLNLNNRLLQPGQPLWLEHRQSQWQAELDQKVINLVQTTRIGISEGADLPWRWYVGNCAAISKL